jgi:SPP1 gp7 family putative phage head morphogenesis protein
MARSLRLDDIVTRHQVLVHRLAAGEVTKFTKFLKQMDREIRDKLAGGELTEFTRARLEKLLASIDTALGDILGTFTADLTQNAVEFGQHEAETSAKALQVVVDVETAVPAASTVRAAIFSNPLAVQGHGGGKLLADFVKDWSTAEVNAVNGAIRRGVFQGQTNSQIVQAIRGTAKRGYADGLLETTARHARSVVQTAVQHVSTIARMTTFAQNSDIVSGVQWLSTLDNHTCDSCAALDLKEFPPDKGPRPPLHVNCRCTTVAVLKDEFAALNQRTARPSVGPDGAQPASAGVSYFDWLKGQPADFQNEAIGPRRAQLLRNGGLSADRFAQLQLDKNFEPMTLAEMKLLEPLAFKEAGL